MEITPGRPTIAEHRHPNDTVRWPVDFKKADIRTKLNILTITAGEQQTMVFYQNIGNTYYNDLDPTATWLENLLLHEYTECYLYYSFYQDEVDPHIKPIWEMHLHQEIAHLHRAAALLAQYENKQWQQVIPGGTFPKLLKFQDNTCRTD